ncbi:hypothetical protein BN2476_2040013 [Paraburkholderia piptadeniae]|uniref:Transposase n=1 Tax=Paraburkholderia piptadeniae TaxID=1701573 RepID=A0A1N7SXN9_9BURK|nr:hypothetical protein BN2476_2040013 [Paraburkholderia piptadeniae]
MRQSRREALIPMNVAFEPGARAGLLPTQLRGYPGAKADLPELAQVKKIFLGAVARVNNRVENSHRPTCSRERQIAGFAMRAHRYFFRACFGLNRRHFALF